MCLTLAISTSQPPPISLHSWSKAVGPKRILSVCLLACLLASRWSVFASAAEEATSVVFQYKVLDVLMWEAMCRVVSLLLTVKTTFFNTKGTVGLLLFGSVWYL